MDVINDIGGYVGILALLGLALLAFLIFTQARHLRDLEEKATYLPEDLDLDTVTEQQPEPAAVAAGEETAQQPAGEAAQPELQAARQVEMARAAAERRQRFQQRRRPGLPSRPGGGGGGMPAPRSMAVIVAGVAVLAVGIVFGATQILGGDDEDGGAGSGAAQTAPGAQASEDIEVAVLNGTPQPGLAASFAQDVRSSFKLGFVGNTETPFEASVVMFDQGRDADGQAVAGALGIDQVQPMDAEVRRVAEGAPVAFVVGEDRAEQQ